MTKKLLLELTTGTEGIDSLANEIKLYLKDYSILLLEGDLGSGKTTFSKTLLKKLGVDSEVTSPTFNIVNEYSLEDGNKVFHFDLYRIRYIEELEEIGFFDYIDSGHYCLIEWPGIIIDHIPGRYLKLEISHLDRERKYVLEAIKE